MNAQPKSQSPPIDPLPGTDRPSAELGSPSREKGLDPNKNQNKVEFSTLPEDLSPSIHAVHPDVPSGFTKLWRETLEAVTQSMQNPIQWSGWNQPAIGLDLSSDDTSTPSEKKEASMEGAFGPPTPSLQVVEQTVPWNIMLNPENVWGPAVSWEQPWEWMWEDRFHVSSENVPQNKRSKARPEHKAWSWDEQRDAFNSKAFHWDDFA